MESLVLTQPLSPFSLKSAFFPTAMPRGGEGAFSPLLAFWNSLGTEAIELEDVTRLLPAEMVVKVLLYLEPQDLCNASSVCHRWHQLAQCGVLDNKRRCYMQHQREEYKQFKENFAPGTTHSLVQRVAMTKAPSPLCNIQLTSSPSPFSHSRSQPNSPTMVSPSPSPTLLLSFNMPSQQPLSKSSSPRSRTSSPTHLLDGLSLNSRPLSPTTTAKAKRLKRRSLRRL